MSESGEFIQLQKNDTIILPDIRITPLGEYSKALEQVWDNFAEIRKDGFYASTENNEYPRFSETFALHGVAGRLRREKGTFIFVPPDTRTIKSITEIGVVSSDVEFEGHPPGNEEETSGTADFYTPDKKYSSLTEFMGELRRRIQIGNEFVTGIDEDASSATIMFAFDTSRPGMNALMEHSMMDNQPKESLWASQFGDYINFPTPGSGLHLAIPIGLPANYIEYAIINDQSPYWKDDNLYHLKETLVCDGNPIPMVSVHTGEIIK